MGDWRALAQAVIDRRVELGHHSREAFAKASGISIRTLGDIESARRTSYAPETLVRVEKALQWPPGAVLAALGDDATRRGIQVDSDVTRDDATLDVRNRLEAKLLLFKLWAPKLDPADHDRLLASLGVIYEWLEGRVLEGLPDEERIAPDFGPDGPQRPPSRRAAVNAQAVTGTRAT